MRNFSLGGSGASGCCRGDSSPVSRSLPGGFSGFPTQGGKQDHIANAGAVGQQHHQPVYAHATAAGGRHAVFERTDEVMVVEHGFVVAAVLGLDLGVEAGGLLFGVVQLPETVPEFAAATVA